MSQRYDLVWQKKKNAAICFLNDTANLPNADGMHHDVVFALVKWAQAELHTV